MEIPKEIKQKTQFNARMNYEIVKLRAKGMSFTQIGKALGCSTQNAQRVCKLYGHLYKEFKLPHGRDFIKPKK